MKRRITFTMTWTEENYLGKTKLFLIEAKKTIKFIGRINLNLTCVLYKCAQQIFSFICSCIWIEVYNLTMLLPGWLCYPFWGLHIWENFNKVHDRRDPAEGVTEGVRPGPLQRCYHGRGSRTLPQYGCSLWPAAWGAKTVSLHSV